MFYFFTPAICIKSPAFGTICTLINFFSRLDSPSSNSITFSTEAERPSSQPNGRSVAQANNSQTDGLYEIPSTVKHNTDNHVDISNKELPHHRLRPTKDPGKSVKSAEMSETDKKRSQFRRSPSYTNAISIDNDTPQDGVATPTSQGPGNFLSQGTEQSAGIPLPDQPATISVPQANCHEISPKRCPSYSHAVELSPFLNGRGDNSDPGKQPRAKTKYFDGKYYVGVANETDENSL